MSPANPAPARDGMFLNDAVLRLLDLANRHSNWFMSEDGRMPLEVNRSEFDFLVAHGRLIFSCWTQRGARAWCITDWNGSDEKLVLQASRKMGAEISRIELVPRARQDASVWRSWWHRL